MLQLLLVCHLQITILRKEKQHFLSLSLKCLVYVQFCPSKKKAVQCFDNTVYSFKSPSRSKSLLLENSVPECFFVISKTPGFLVSTRIQKNLATFFMFIFRTYWKDFFLLKVWSAQYIFKQSSTRSMSSHWIKHSLISC